MRGLRGAVVALAAAMALVWAVIPEVVADPRCKVLSRVATDCLITALDPGAEPAAATERSSSDPAQPASGTRKSGSTGLGSPCVWEGEGKFTYDMKAPVPCTSEYGIWSNRLNCYVSPSPIDPQPPATASEWDGHSPGGGAIYFCYTQFGGPLGGIWLADPPAAADVGPAPGEVAQIAVKRMNLRAIEIGMSPSPDGAGVVGQPMWLWVQDPGEHTTGPITRTASAGSVTVTATARLERIVWEMGDGTQVVCTGPGTPYTADHGMAASPDCGHTYTRESGYEPGQRYTVTATSEWVVDWTGSRAASRSRWARHRSS
ncbi:hypothetical protein ACFT1B_35280 [Streptomyces griseoincarnatus]